MDCAHEMGAKVVAEGVERVDEFRAMAELGVDLGQGFYFGQPTERPMAVDTASSAPAPSSSEQRLRVGSLAERHGHDVHLRRLLHPRRLRLLRP